MPSESATGLGQQTDEVLLRALWTEEDRLTRDIADEIVRRGDRMTGRLAEICTREFSWQAHGRDFWAPVHAAYLLGTIGGEKVLEGLLAALHYSVRHKVDWVSERIPNLLGSVGRPAIPYLKVRARDPQTASREATLALRSLAAIAARHPVEQGEILDFFKALVEDEKEDDPLRDQAASELLRFARPGDRRTLQEWATYAATKVFDPLIDRKDLEEAFRRTVPEVGEYLQDWMDFYRPEEIARRQEVWSRGGTNLRPSLREFEELSGKPFLVKGEDGLCIDPRRLPPLRELIREEFRPVRVKHHEDQFLFLLMPLELAILEAFRRRREMTGAEVLEALREVVDRFPDPPQAPLSARIYQVLHVVAAANAGKISDMEILACLNRIRDSVKHHGGTRGYLHFLDRLMP